MRNYDLANPILSNPGNAVGPQGPAGQPGPPGTRPFDIQIFSGEFSTTSDAGVRAGARFIDLSAFPELDVSSNTRVIEFVANLEVAVAGTGTAKLVNRDDAEDVTGATVNTSSLTNIELRSGPLTVGVSAGNLKDDRMYEIEVSHTGGTANDMVTITNARLEIYYV